MNPVAGVSAQYVEHGGALTNAGEGGASPEMWFVCTNCALSSRPRTPATTPDSEDGTVRFADGERTVSPFTRYLPKLTPNAVAACARVPSTDT